MAFNASKLKVVCFGKLNQGTHRPLGCVTEQRDTRAQIHSSLKVVTQAERVV